MQEGKFATRSISSEEDGLMPEPCAARRSHVNGTLRTRVTRVPFPAQHGAGDLLNCKMKPREHSMKVY